MNYGFFENETKKDRKKHLKKQLEIAKRNNNIRMQKILEIKKKEVIR